VALETPSPPPAPPLPPHPLQLFQQQLRDGLPCIWCICISNAATNPRSPRQSISPSSSLCTIRSFSSADLQVAQKVVAARFKTYSIERNSFV
jgi:hypothetical protein